MKYTEYGQFLKVGYHLQNRLQLQGFLYFQKAVKLLRNMQINDVHSNIYINGKSEKLVTENNFVEKKFLESPA